MQLEKPINRASKIAGIKQQVSTRGVTKLLIINSTAQHVNWQIHINHVIEDSTSNLYRPYQGLTVSKKLVVRIEQATCYHLFALFIIFLQFNFMKNHLRKVPATHCFGKSCLRTLFVCSQGICTPAIQAVLFDLFSVILEEYISD